MLEKENLDKERRRILIQRIQELPTLPSSILKIIQLADNASSTPTELASVISKDPSISSMIIKLVNSAFYGYYRQISSISHAVVILGYQTVKTMALGVSVFQNAPSRPRQAFDRKAFWVHSLGVATITKKLYTKIGRIKGVDAETLFLSGLLHDVGKVAFDNFFNDEYESVAAEAQKNNEWIRNTEIRKFQMDHTEAGFHLAKTWKFPEAVMAGIRFHHDLKEAIDLEEPALKAAAYVSVADYICRKIKIGSGGDNAEPDLLDEALSACGVSMEEVDALASSEEMAQDKAMIETFANG